MPPCDRTQAARLVSGLWHVDMQDTHSRCRVGVASQGPQTSKWKCRSDVQSFTKLSDCRQCSIIFPFIVSHEMSFHPVCVSQD